MGRTHLGYLLILVKQVIPIMKRKIMIETTLADRRTIKAIAAREGITTPQAVSCMLRVFVEHFPHLKPKEAIETP